MLHFMLQTYFENMVPDLKIPSLVEDVSNIRNNHSLLI